MSRNRLIHVLCTACFVTSPVGAQTAAEERTAITGAAIFAACVESVIGQTGATAQEIVASVVAEGGNDAIEFRHDTDRCQISIATEAVDASLFFAEWSLLRSMMLNLPAGQCSRLSASNPAAEITYCDLPELARNDGNTIRFRVAEAVFTGVNVDLLLTEAPDL